jgi:TrmH RNA methyltransferase
MKKLLRVSGLPAVSALLAVAPERVEQLFFDNRMQRYVAELCAKLARMRRSYRLAGTDELERIAGTMLHGGIVALAQPRPVSPIDPIVAKAWAADGRLLLLLDGVGNPTCFERRKRSGHLWPKWRPKLLTMSGPECRQISSDRICLLSG